MFASSKKVDLFFNDGRGEMMQFIPKWVNLMPAIQQYTVFERSITDLVKGRMPNWKVFATMTLR